MSFQDSAVIFFIALLLFGPKKLPELARQLGKLMGEFRRASNEFRMQLEDELRTSEQAEKQKQIAALQAAAPPPVLPTDPEPAPSDLAIPENTIAPPIASSGNLHLQAPETGLPIARGAIQAPAVEAFDSVPQAAELAPDRHTNLPPDGHTAPLHESTPEAHA